DANAEFFADSGQLLPGEEQHRYMAHLFSKRRDLVDSAAVLGHGAVGIYWHGERVPYIIMYPPTPGKASTVRSGLTTANDLARDLSNGCLIIVGRGVTSIPRGGRPEAESEIDDLIHGRSHKPQFVILREDIDDFTNRKTIPDILRSEKL